MTTRRQTTTVSSLPGPCPHRPAARFIVVLVRSAAALAGVVGVIAASAAAAFAQSQIAFEREGEIIVVNADGTEQQAIATGVDPSFSFDGSAIAYGDSDEAFVDASQCFIGNTAADIHIVHPDGSAGTDLGFEGIGSGFNPSISGDGQVVAVERGTECGTRAFLWTADGSYLPLSVDAHAGEFTDETLVPALSGDTRRLAFEVAGQISVVDTGDWTAVSTPLAAGHDPAYSPDGDRIAFERNGTIYTVDEHDGTGEVEIASGRHPAYSPDGGSIAFDRGGTIYIAAADGSGTEQPVTDGLEGEPIAGKDPSWGGEVEDADPSFACLDEEDPCTKLAVEVEDLPGTGGWKKVDPESDALDDRLYDGARIRLTVAVVNNNVGSRQPIDMADVEFADDRMDFRGVVPLAGAGESGEIPYDEDGEPTEVSFEWEADGYAWNVGAPALERVLEVSFDDSLDYSDGAEPEALTRSVTIRPRPIVLVHGMNDDATTWNGYNALLRAEHPLWEAYPVGDHSFGTSVMNTRLLDMRGGLPVTPVVADTMAENASVLADYVTAVRDRLDAPQVDLIAHDSGGLIARRYLSDLVGTHRGKPYVRHLLMYGTPNKGIACLDLLRFNVKFWTFFLRAPETLRKALEELVGTYPSSQIAAFLRPRVLDELEDALDELSAFADFPDDRGDVQYAVLAGDNYPGVRCGDDGWVDVGSALGDYQDTEIVDGIHHSQLHKQPDAVSSFALPRLSEDPDDLGASLARRLGAASLLAPRVGAAASLNAQVGGGTSEGTELAVAPLVLEVPADGSVEYEIPVAAPASLTVSALVGPTVKSELFDPDGAAASTIEAGSAAAALGFRAHVVDNPEAGTWRLRLSQEGASGAVVALVGAVVEDGALSLAGSASQAGPGAPVTMTATALRAGVPVSGAVVGGAVSSADAGESLVELRDDGAGADTVANDGSFAGSSSFPGLATTVKLTAALADGIVLAEVDVEQLPAAPSVSMPPSPSPAPPAGAAPIDVGGPVCPASKGRLKQAKRQLRKAKRQLKQARVRLRKLKKAKPRPPKAKRRLRAGKRNVKRAKRRLKKTRRKLEGARRQRC